MLLSMTGFSISEADLVNDIGEHLNLTIEIKTLNARFFESSCRLPSSLGHLEHNIISRCKKQLIRGRTFLTVRVGSSGISLEKVVPSMDIAQDYIHVVGQIKEKFQLPGDITLSDFLRLPNLFVLEKGGIKPDQEKAFLESLDQTLAMLIENRRKEGESLEQDLRIRFTNCAVIIKTINGLAAEELYKRKIEVQEALISVEQGDEYAKRRLEELYKILDKIDVHEEVTRFQSHLKAIGELFDDERYDKGRRLDFILQELMREINTITAKCSNYPITAAAVDIKVELEKAREQTQNIL